MSWNFRKCGKNKESLKVAVQAETACPESIRAEICARIDGVRLDWAPGSAVYVASHGHFEAEPNPFRGVSEIKINVQPIPFIDTPE